MNRHTTSSAATTSPPMRPRSSLQCLLLGQGLTGLMFFCLLAGGGGAALWQLGTYTCEVLETFTINSESKTQAGEYLQLAARLITLLPLLPLLLVAVFLPLRLAWIHGQVRWGALFHDLGDSLRRALFTLQFTWRQLLVLSIPLVALAIFLHELKAAHQPEELVIFVQIATAGFGIAVLWQAIAVLCAAPICILAQCDPLAAARECTVVVRSAYRFHILLSLLLIFALIIAVGWITTTQPLELEVAWGIRVGALIPLWMLLTHIGHHCLIATVAHLETR